MAQDPQALFEFTKNLLSDLDEGHVTAQEALSACNQYAYLREVIISEGDALSQTALSADAEFTETVRSLIASAVEKLKELPSFQSQQPDNGLSEKDIRDSAALRASAVDRVKQTTAARLNSSPDRRRAFIHNLVSRFSSTLSTPPNEQQIDRVVDRSLVAAAGEAATRQTKERFAELLDAALEINGAAVSAETKNKLKGDVRATLAEQDAYITSALSAAGSGRILAKTVFQNIGIERPDVLVDVVLNAPAVEPQKDTIARGLKLAGVAASLQHSGAATVTPRQFFTSANARGAARGLQQAADGLLSLVGEPVREILIYEKINGTLRSMLTNTQSFIDRLGENFVRSAIFTQIAQNVSKSLTEKPPAGQARGVVGDVISSIFRGPLDPAITRGATGRILDYFELARANASAPKGFEFLPLGVAPWHAFPDRLVPGKGRRAWLPAIGFGVVGARIGDAFAAAVNNTISFFLSNPRMPWSFAAARRRAAIPIPFWEDMPLVIAVVIVVFLVIFFVLPSPFNLPQLAQSAKTNALLVSLEQGVGDIVCEKNPDNPICKFEPCVGDCPWPATGRIIQGPYATCDGTTHSRVDAVDIQGHYLEPIYSVTDGNVTAVVGGCADNPAPVGSSISQGCNQNYGNYVEVTTSQGAVLRYSHLSILFIDKIHGGPIKKGNPIGKMDNNGSSGSHHLHFEVRGSSPSNSRVASFLPGTADFARKLYQCINASGCNLCPQQ